MAFKKLTSARLPRRRNKEPAVHLYTRESHRDPDQVETRLRLTKPLLEKLGWAENQRLDVMVGFDDDEGTVQVQPNPVGPFQMRRSTPSGSSFTLSSRVIPMPAGINRKVAYKLEGDCLLVTYV